MKKTMFGVYRVLNTSGRGKTHRIEPGELLLKGPSLIQVLSASKKLGGRIVTIRETDKVVMATRLQAPLGVLE